MHDFTAPTQYTAVHTAASDVLGQALNPARQDVFLTAVLIVIVRGGSVL